MRCGMASMDKNTWTPISEALPFDEDAKQFAQLKVMFAINGTMHFGIVDLVDGVCEWSIYDESVDLFFSIDPSTQVTHWIIIPKIPI